MRALSYLRFSTPEQKLGNSAERQFNAAREYCLRNGLTLDEELSIADEGLSGYKGHHVERGLPYLRAILLFFPVATIYFEFPCLPDRREVQSINYSPLDQSRQSGMAAATPPKKLPSWAMIGVLFHANSKMTLRTISQLHRGQIAHITERTAK
jgi:hypothetical protein